MKIVNDHCYGLSHSIDLISTLPNVFKVNSLKQMLINLSGLIDNEDISLLKKLFECISFKENAVNRGKYQAVLAGSYPAFLAGKVKRYSDIDVFILWNSNDWIDTSFFKTLHILRRRNENAISVEREYIQPYQSAPNGIYTVVDVGRLQFIVKHYEQECSCMYHIDKYFFSSFHHVTRWKLLVMSKLINEKESDIILPKYIPFKEDCGVITERIIIESDDEKRYPAKHADNTVDLYPPTLFQQALHHILKAKDRNHMNI